jgi:hypothetical protein
MRPRHDFEPVVVTRPSMCNRSERNRQAARVPARDQRLREDRRLWRGQRVIAIDPRSMQLVIERGGMRGTPDDLARRRFDAMSGQR